MKLGQIHTVEPHEAVSHSEGEIWHWVGFVHSSVLLMYVGVGP